MIVNKVGDVKVMKELTKVVVFVFKGFMFLGLDEILWGIFLGIFVVVMLL